MNVTFKVASKRIEYLKKTRTELSGDAAVTQLKRITAMALILLLSMIMFFTMLFATANAIRSEVRQERADFLRDRLVK